MGLEKDPAFEGRQAMPLEADLEEIVRPPRWPWGWPPGAFAFAGTAYLMLRIGARREEE